MLATEECCAASKRRVASQAEIARHLSPTELTTLLLSSLGLGGFALLFWSRDLSLRYNAWTTRLREKHPRINPPPTPKMRALNESIMTWIFRFVGALFLAEAIVLLYAGRRYQP
jgi:hypothetical protein